MASHGLGKLLGSAADKIAELEKKLSNAETMGDREQSIHNLEQQAKGVEDCIKETANDKYRISLRDTLDLYNYVDQLRKKAKELKE
jgi:hypothetical protein